MLLEQRSQVDYPKCLLSSLREGRAGDLPVVHMHGQRGWENERQHFDHPLASDPST
jgi:hypothetical protein